MRPRLYPEMKTQNPDDKYGISLICKLKIHKVNCNYLLCYVPKKINAPSYKTTN